MVFDFSIDESVPGECFLSKVPLGALGEVTRIPIFEVPPEEDSGLQSLVGKAVRFEAWQAFDSQESIVEWVINAAVDEFCRDQVLIRSGSVFAAVRCDHHVDTSVLCMPRSAMYYHSMLGDDVKSVELRLSVSCLSELLRFLASDAWGDGVVLQSAKHDVGSLQLEAAPCDATTSWLWVNDGDPVLLRVAAKDVVELTRLFAQAKQ